MQRESLVSISVRAADPAWLCIFHLSLCITKSIKADLGNKETDQFLERLASPVSSFLSYSIFWLIPGWGRETHHVYLFAWASKTHMRASPRQGTLHYSRGCLWAYADGESLLSEALLAFYVNQGIQPLFLFYFLSSLSLQPEKEKKKRRQGGSQISKKLIHPLFSRKAFILLVIHRDQWIMQSHAGSAALTLIETRLSLCILSCIHRS